MYDAAKAVPKTHLMYRPVIANMVMESKLDTKQRISAAAKFLKKITPPAELDVLKVEEACGVGMHMTDDEISTLIDQVFESVADTLQKKGTCLVSERFLPLVNKADPRAKWANGGTVTKTIKAKLEQVLGPRDERDAEMAKKKTRQRARRRRRKVLKSKQKKVEKAGKQKRNRTTTIQHQISFAKPLVWAKVSATQRR